MKKIVALMVLVLIIFSWQKAFAEYTSTAVSADADVRSQFPTTNFGTGNHNYVFRATSGNRGRIFLKFSLPSIPTGSTINQAYVTVKNYTDECSGTPNATYVSALTSDWGENSITWNNQPGASGMTSVYYPCQEPNKWIALPVVGIVREMYAGSRQNYGFLIWGEEGIGNWQRTIYSREFGLSTLSYLYVDYTPPVATTPNPGQTPGGSENTGNSTSGTATTGSSASTTTSASRTAPAAITSKTIEPATNLVLDPVAGTDQTLLKLSWVSSTTTGVDGYKIFRSEKVDSDFLSVAMTDKNTPTFTDSIDASKSYYYKVRAYKGSEESIDSNIVNFASKTNTAVATVKKLTLKEKVINYFKSNKMRAAFAIGALLVLIATIVSIVIIRKKKRAKTKSVNQ
ncbi:MAG: DNRLRE domain-containing protein [Candidatus Berkelbacteria bacterium]|nr:DNRLRE domain-containing protein [Candidatus Berkelbacteria bacterium]